MNNQELELLVSNFIQNRYSISDIISQDHRELLSLPLTEFSSLYNTLAATATAIDLLREMLPFKTSLQHLYPNHNPSSPSST